MTMESTRGRPRLPHHFEPPLAITALFLIWVWGRYIQIGERGGGILGAIRFEFSIGIILALLCLCVGLATPPSIRRSKHVVLGIVMLFVAMAVQVPFAVFPPVAQDIFVDRVVKFAFLTFFLATLVRSPRALRWFLVTWMISMFWITQESVRGLLTGSLIWENQGIMRLHGSVGIYRHPNSLSGVSLGVLPFIVYLLPLWRRWWKRGALLALLTTSMTCVLYSGSRTGYLAFLGFLLFYFARSGRKMRWVITVAVVTPIFLFAIPDEYKGRFETIGAPEEEQDGSQILRREINRDAWEIFRENPGGVGLGGFKIVRYRKFQRSQDTHNLYLEVATNLGIQGFAIFTFFVGAMLVGLHKAANAFNSQLRILQRIAAEQSPHHLRREIRSHLTDLRFLGAVANGAMGYIFIRLMLGAFGHDLYEIYWWFGAGLAIVLLEMIDRMGQRTEFLRLTIFNGLP